MICIISIFFYFFSNFIEKHVMTHNKERQVLTCKYNCGFSTKQGTQLSYHYRMQHLTNTSGDAVKSKEMLKNLNVTGGLFSRVLHRV